MEKEEYLESMRMFLGTLTSHGKHYSGLIEMFAKLMLEDIASIKCDDNQLQKQLTNDVRTLVESATKHRELIEKVLVEWRNVNTTYIVESDTSPMTNDTAKSPETYEKKSTLKSNIQNIIKHLEYVRERPRTFLNDDFSALNNFLRGFNYACFVLGVDLEYHDAYSAAQIERGWEVTPTHPIKQMEKAGLTKDEILSVALDIELAAWKKVLEQQE